MKGVAILRKVYERLGGIFGSKTSAYTTTDSLFARQLARRRMSPHDVFFGYSYASLEVLREETKKGVLSIVDQIDPGRYEWRLVQEERKKWPEYDRPKDSEPKEYFDRAKKEWEIADVVIVNSKWSKGALEKQGVNADKIEVLPLAYEDNGHKMAKASTGKGRDNPLTVLWLGSVSVRKGIPYLVEAARELTSANIRFVIAGPLKIREEAVRNAPSNMEWLGQVPRSQTPELYKRADVFVLPTISDGFAITQLEALAHGTPLVVTPNCGRVVEDGETGFVVEPRDPDSIAEALCNFEDNRALIQEMHPKCKKISSRYTVDAYGDKLHSIISSNM
jgi:glycosyltransferase involved in cell wall biosynthesis